jgi:phosphohistidine swiveling domain-containing protein
VVTRQSFVEALGAGPANRAQLGGKGASLARLVQLGHAVPPGLTVKVDAFVACLDHLGVRSAFDDVALASPHALEAAGASILAALAEGRVPDEVLDAITAEMEATDVWGDDGIILRSSAVAEDARAHSFAGIFESIRVTRPDQLEPTLREVWSSAFAPRALAYAREAGVDGVPAMAIVVQRFLDADRSGVMFTRFPRPGGGLQILVEHVAGGCEKLVKGEVTPARLWLGAAEDRAGWGEMFETQLGGLHRRYAECLQQLAGRLEQEFGGPQDVEWVVHGGEVHVVQTRPITSAAADAGAPLTAVVAAGVAPLVAGVSAARGAAAGDVALVFNIEQAMAIARGDVLVTPMTNPDMVVAMRRSAAIVTDVGGMICHAAIVSRELGLPCVVGTERATTTLRAGAPVTVDGTRGHVYGGILELDRTATRGAPMEWADLWAFRPADRVSRAGSAAALTTVPEHVAEVEVLADVDLRADAEGLWLDLEGSPAAARHAVAEAWIERVTSALSDRPDVRLTVVTRDSGVHDSLTESAAGRLRVTRMPAAAPTPSAAAFNTSKFFGHTPAAQLAAMPDPEWRGRWWALLPEYGRFHTEHRTSLETGEYEWLEVRPEVVISALLKSLVQPGFEMVPRVLGFPDIGPLHLKWIRCRYWFRADSFARVWEALVRATWDRQWMAALMRNVRASYDHLAEVLLLFPQTDDALRSLTGAQLAALITAWWPRWVEFFALCWFIQAQGDDIAYPFVEEVVEDNLARLGPPPEGLAWPPITDLLSPTTAVMSAQYMAAVDRVRDSLVAAGLTDVDTAEAAIIAGTHPAASAAVADLLRDWGWMRDRDLLFEPWDTTRKVVEIALSNEPHRPVSYADNLARNVLALAFHTEMAASDDRAAALAHGVRFLQDLNVERENHHVLWLKLSYPLRRVCVEIERRLLDSTALAPGDVFFLQAPELIDAARAMPTPLAPDLVARVKNRRAGYLREANLSAADTDVTVEDDYY